MKSKYDFRLFFFAVGRVKEGVGIGGGVGRGGVGVGVGVG